MYHCCAFTFISKQLASLLQQQKKPSEALEVVDKLLVELKKLDDKQMLTETHLTESRIYHSLQNIPKGDEQSHYKSSFFVLRLDGRTTPTFSCSNAVFKILYRVLNNILCTSAPLRAQPRRV